MIVINQVNMEDYVAGVIPGEMPVSYGEEALKVQAVCARTFGRRALGTTFRDYPANSDDTVSSRYIIIRKNVQKVFRPLPRHGGRYSKIRKD